MHEKYIFSDILGGFDMETYNMTPQEAGEHAKNYFRKGMNCTECVMATFLDIHGSDFPRAVLSLATGFGAGMGHTKNTCGAITGAVMALSAAVGRKDPLEKETMAERVEELKKIYDIEGRMVEEIKQKYGTLICSELSAPMGEFEGKTRKKNCMQMIGECTEIAMRYVLEAEQNARTE